MNPELVAFQSRFEQAMKVWFGEEVKTLSDRPRGKPAIVVEDPRLGRERIFVFQDSGMVCLMEDELTPLKLWKAEEVTDTTRYMMGCCRAAQYAGVDKDLTLLSAPQLIVEAMKLRTAIREHRDERGNDRFRFDDARLYQALPEGATVFANMALPERGQFLSNCARYYEERQVPDGPRE